MFEASEIRDHHFESFPAPANSQPRPEACVTDWAWFEKFVLTNDGPNSARYAKWLQRRKTLGFLDDLQALRHEVLYQLTEADVRAACTDVEHALGELEKKDAAWGTAANYFPPVPMVYLFHAALEDLGRIPSWDEFKHYIWEGRPDMMWEPFCREEGLDPRRAKRPKNEKSLKAFSWRLGIAYYSCLREVHMLTALRRKHGLDIRYHFLVDAEWKADFAQGGIMVELYMINSRYKSDDGGRKLKCQIANPHGDVKVAPFDKSAVERGKVCLVADAEISRVAAELRASGCPLID